MKRILLLPFLIMSTACLWGNAERSRQKIVVEKDGIKVQYQACIPCSTNKFGPTYYLTITNKSADPIVVGPSIIGIPLYTDYQEMARIQREQTKLFAKWSTGATSTIGSISFIAWFLSRNKPIPYLAEGITAGILSTALTATFAATSLFLMMYIEKFLANNMLREPITIQPGKSVSKRFWLKNQNDQVKINFDTIQVLK